MLKNYLYSIFGGEICQSALCQGCLFIFFFPFKKIIWRCSLETYCLLSLFLKKIKIIKLYLLRNFNPESSPCDFKYKLCMWTVMTCTSRHQFSQLTRLTVNNYWRRKYFEIERRGINKKLIFIKEIDCILE